MKLLLIALIFIISCSFNEDSSERSGRYELIKITDFDGKSISEFIGPIIDNKLYGNFIGIDYLDLITGEVKHVRLKWENYNYPSLGFFEYDVLLVQKTYARNDSLFAMGKLPGNLNLHLYYIDMKNSVATLYRGDTVSLNEIVYSIVLNNKEVALSKYGDVYLFDNNNEKWMSVNDFDNWCYLYSAVSTNNNEIYYTCGSELRKVTLQDSVYDDVVMNNDSLEGAILYKNANNHVRLIMGNAVYEIKNDSLRYLNKINNELVANCGRHIIKDDNVIHYSDTTLFFYNNQLVVDYNDKISILDNTTLSDQCYNFEDYFHRADGKMYVLNVHESTINSLVLP